MGAAPDIFSMSDEDFLKNPPATEVEAASTEKTAAQETPTDPAPEVKEEPKTEQVAAEQATAQTQQTAINPLADDDKKIEEAAASGQAKPAQTQTDPADPNKDGAQPKAAETDPSKDGEGEKGEKVAESEKQDPAFFEAAYKRIMAPFKANGKLIELKSPEEVIQLMQMGANYTRKMQELVPHRKVLTMLQNNELLDEGKLSFLIDLSKKNPEAIKKLVKDAGIDPMDIDTSVEPAYQEGNHRVSDDEVAFRSALEDMKSTPERKETLRVINDWDQASKEALWKNPSLMNLFHEQREIGVYDRVVAEVNRRQTLGQVPANVPFLQAYKVIGDEMVEAGAFADLGVKPAAKAPVATRVAAPKTAVTNNERAAAASPTRQAPAAAKGSSVNPLAMADDEFLKQFAGRV